MKILIIDDNVAIQEIIRDILVSEGHIVRVAGSTDEGQRKAEAFSPDIVFLEYNIAGDQTLSTLKSGDGMIQTKIVLIKSNQDREPTDDKRVVTSINKPFTSNDIKAAVQRASSACITERTEAAAVERVNVERKKLNISRLLHKKKPVAKPIHRDKDDFKIGISYVIFEDNPDYISRLMSTFSFEKYSIIVVTSERSKIIHDRFGGLNDKLGVISMGYSDKGEVIEIHRLGSLIATVKGFVGKEHFDGEVVVFMDNINDLISANGFDSTVRMIYQLLAESPSDKWSYIISVSNRNMSDKDRGIFLHGLTEYNIAD